MHARRGRSFLVTTTLVAVGCGGDPLARDSAAPGRTVTVSVSDERSGAPDPSADTAAAERRCPGASELPTGDDPARAAQVTLCLVNHEREQRGRSALEPDDLLAGAAQRKAQDMVDRRYFAHVGPDGKDVRDWVRGTGYLPDGGYELGENLGWGPDDSATPARIVAGWMDSPTHRRNILAGEFEDSGIGIVAGVPREGAEPGATYVHMFGSQDPPG